MAENKEWKETEFGKVPIDWNIFKLKEKVDVIMGQSPSSNFYNKNKIGLPFMQGRTTFGDKYHTINMWTSEVKRIAIKDSVLMSVRAPVGDLNIAINELCIGRGLASLNMKNGNNEFLFYLLKAYRDQILNKETGTVFGSINKSGIENLELPFPPFLEQKKIAAILKSLDDKIELNNRMNETLEEMAQTIFKEWFVNFNFPNEEGKPYKDNGGKMVESELGMIPEGWRVGSIDEIAEVVAGGTPSKKIDEYFSIEKEISWITPKDLSGYNGKFIGRGAVDITKLGLQKSSAKLMPKGTVLFSSRAPIGYIAIAKNNITTNQGFKSLVPNKGLGTEYLYYMLHDIKEDIENNASGSTFKEVSGTEMKKHKLIIPLIRISDLFEKIISKWSNMILKNEVETANLTKIRDTLLPKLMSGKVRV